MTPDNNLTSKAETEVQKLASFVVNARYEDISAEACGELKIRILDSLGCAIGALAAETARFVRAQVDEFGGNKLCTLIGGGRSAPDRAAFYNGALVRYLDFNDSYLARRETCHPSDNVGPVLAGAEYAKKDGRTVLTALAVAYQVQCRLSEAAPVREKGFDHTVQGSYAIAAGVSKALGLDRARTANAIAICGTALNALRVTRTGVLSHWKGLAYPHTAFGATHATFLAMRGITGPLEVFEGNKGFMDAIAGRFHIDWASERLESVTRTIVKRFNAEVHSQSAIEGILELKDTYDLKAGDVESIEIEIFDVAYNIIGGGEEGDKTVVETKEQADHSLQYLVAVALLDGQVMPGQYLPGRIVQQDVQALLRKVSVRPLKDYSNRFPDEMPCRLKVTLRDARVLIREKRDYEGFHTRRMKWETVVKKFEKLTEGRVHARLGKNITETIAHLENCRVADLTRLIRMVRAR